MFLHFTWTCVILSLLFSGTVASADSSIRGAQGLDARANVTAEACQTLAATWRRTGDVPVTVDLAGRTRRIVDLSGEDVVPGVDIRQPLQAAFDRAAMVYEPILFLPPTAEGERYQRSGRVTLAVPGVDLCGFGAHLAGTNATDLGFGLQADGIGVYGLTLEAPPETFASWPELWQETSGAEPPGKYPTSDARAFGTWASHVIVVVQKMSSCAT